MGKHSGITVSQISDNDLINKIENAAADVLANQSWWARRKNSLTAAANIVIQTVNVLLFALGDVPIGVTIAIATIFSLAEIVIHAGTKAPVTPASAARIVEAADARMEAEPVELPTVADYYRAE